MSGTFPQRPTMSVAWELKVSCRGEISAVSAESQRSGGIERGDYAAIFHDQVHATRIPFILTCMHSSDGLTAFLRVSLLMVRTLDHACIIYVKLATFNFHQKPY